MIKSEGKCAQTSAQDTSFIKKAPKCVKWYETSEGYIKIRVFTNDPSDIRVDVDENYLSLYYNDSNNGCDVKLKFFGCIKPETRSTKVTPCCLYISVEKSKLIEWTNLFDSKTKLNWIVYDFDNVEISEKSPKAAKINEKINWPSPPSNTNGKKGNHSSIEFRLPEDDDHFEPTSSELSELEGFNSDVEDHEQGF